MPKQPPKNTRPYHVRVQTGKVVNDYIVENATSPAQAVRVATSQHTSVAALNATETLRLMREGVPVLNALGTDDTTQQTLPGVGDDETSEGAAQ
jgi:hypothetical protein